MDEAPEERHHVSKVQFGNYMLTESHLPGLEARHYDLYREPREHEGTEARQVGQMRVRPRVVGLPSHQHAVGEAIANHIHRPGSQLLQRRDIPWLAGAVLVPTGKKSTTA